MIVLLAKDRGKGNKVTNFHPIVCLPIIRKLLTGMIVEELHNHLEQAELLPDEQKGCRKEKEKEKRSKFYSIIN